MPLSMTWESILLMYLDNNFRPKNSMRKPGRSKQRSLKERDCSSQYWIDSSTYWFALRIHTLSLRVNIWKIIFWRSWDSYTILILMRRPRHSNSLKTQSTCSNSKLFRWQSIITSSELLTNTWDNLLKFVSTLGTKTFREISKTSLIKKLASNLGKRPIFSETTTTYSVKSTL